MSASRSRSQTGPTQTNKPTEPRPCSLCNTRKSKIKTKGLNSKLPTNASKHKRMRQSLLASKTQELIKTKSHILPTRPGKTHRKQTDARLTIPNHQANQTSKLTTHPTTPKTQKRLQWGKILSKKKTNPSKHESRIPPKHAITKGRALHSWK